MTGFGEDILYQLRVESVGFSDLGIPTHHSRSQPMSLSKRSLCADPVRNVFAFATSVCQNPYGIFAKVCYRATAIAKIINRRLFFLCNTQMLRLKRKSVNFNASDNG
jgi:hypothetical protein